MAPVIEQNAIEKIAACAHIDWAFAVLNIEIVSIMQNGLSGLQGLPRGRTTKPEPRENNSDVLAC
jgi:hypothetical protein